MKAEFGGNRTKAWELVHTVELGDIEDHNRCLDIDDPQFDGVDVVRIPFGLEIKVAGKQCSPTLNLYLKEDYTTS